jgi:uncharacterized oxidoreductase
MSRLFPASSVLQSGITLFRAAGARPDEANAVVEALVTSSLMGHDSHGVIRIPEYLGFIVAGSLRVDAEISVQYTGPTTAIVDCGHGFGAVGARRAVQEGIRIAREQRTACVVTRRCNHVGRLGAWVEDAADAGMIAIATCSSPSTGHHVLPWGGRDGRLGTNPIAYGIPTSGDPIIADFATSVAPEGKVRFYRNEGKPVPPGWILDAQGTPTDDPNKFYGPPKGGILPLGGSAGHKGFALSLLVDVLGNALAGVPLHDPEFVGNGNCFIVIDPASFCSGDLFRRLVDETIAYMKSSRPVPGVEEVLVPGEIEFRNLKQRQVDGIPVDDFTRQAMQDYAGRWNVAIDLT